MVFALGGLGPKKEILKQSNRDESGIKGHTIRDNIIVSLGGLAVIERQDTCKKIYMRV